jgi:hypothetical protein
MLSTPYHDVVVYERTSRPHRRMRFRGPLAAFLTIAAVIASGAVMSRLDDASSRAAMGVHQPQPFDYFPR